jgi:hypothetical protein
MGSRVTDTATPSTKATPEYPVPPEYSIAWLICAVTCGLEAVMVG